MADSTIANLTDGATADATDRIPVERSPFGAGTNRYVTPAYIKTYIETALKLSTAATAGAGPAIAAGTATTDVQALSLTQTWNNAAIAFTARKTNITDTASAAGSLIEDWQVGGSSKASIDKTGLGNFAGGLGWGAPGAGRGFFTVNGGNWTLGSGIGYGWSSNADGAAAFADTALFRDSAGLVSIRTGGNPVIPSNGFGRLKVASAIAAGVAVGSLNASPTTGEIQSVTDALAPAVGVAVASGGSAKALVWYNGAQWTVIGV